MLLLLHSICLFPVDLVKERALTEICTNILLIEESSFLYFLHPYIGSTGEVVGLLSVLGKWELWDLSSVCIRCFIVILIPYSRKMQLHLKEAIKSPN